MRNLFKGFYNPGEQDLSEAWKSDNTIFVFDTNVFLNLYSYATQTRSDFFSLFSKIQARIWIPYHVILEYQRRRLEVVRDEKAIFNKINDLLDKVDKIFTSDFESLALKRRFPKLNENTDKLHKEIQKSVATYKKSVSYWDEQQPCVRSHDTIREELNNLVENRVGNKPESQNWLDSLYTDGETRYQNKIPPGFMDETKSKAPDRYFFYDDLKYDRQYGDLIIWKQIIEKAKEEQVQNVIFVTDDVKQDWWYILDSRGKKQIGPHAHLQNEIYKLSNIHLFQMYNTSSFFEDAKKYIDKTVINDSSIIDATQKLKLNVELIDESARYLRDLKRIKLFEQFKNNEFQNEKIKELNSKFSDYQFKKIIELNNELKNYRSTELNKHLSILKNLDLFEKEKALYLKSQLSNQPELFDYLQDDDLNINDPNQELDDSEN